VETRGPGEDQLHRLGEQHLLPGIGDLGGPVDRAFRLVSEDQRDVHVPGAQHAQRFWRFGLGQP
jgi:hypothetical protein